MGNYELFSIVNGEPVNISGDTFISGTTILIVANITNADYYNFIGFAGTELADTINLTGRTIQFDLTSNRFITINFESKTFNVIDKTDTSSASGKININKNEYEVGDTVVLSFDINSGFEIRSWVFYDKDGNEHEASTLTSNIKYSNNTVALTIDQYWLDNFGLEFESKVETMMNSTFLIVLVVGGITIPLLLALILVFIILNNKKKAQAKAAAERAAKNKFGLNQQEFIKRLTEDDNNKK